MTSPPVFCIGGRGLRNGPGGGPGALTAVTRPAEVRMAEHVLSPVLAAPLHGVFPIREQLATDADSVTRVLADDHGEGRPEDVRSLAMVG